MGLELAGTRGVLNHYGPRSTERKYGGKHTKKDAIKEVSWTFDATDLPTGGTSAMEYSIPAGATIVSARAEIITAVVSTSTTTDLLIGLVQADGTEIDYDGFLTAAQLDQAAILVEGSLTTGTGALVGFTIGAAAGELSVTASAADLLSGRVRVLVEYIV